LSGNLKDAYAVADLVISRAGNNVIAELAALAKPAILVPMPSSVNNHQLENARIISRAGGGLLMFQENLTPEKLVRQIQLLFADPDEMKSMSEKIKQFAKLDAAKLVAEEVFKEGQLSAEEGVADDEVEKEA
jgi:UDP-N-acetylglucosamine--N-acetylmuramyl-(pentapeptide) pyrophosphoryl-undecaprenol N-acetylglucosamine transferase